MPRINYSIIECLLIRIYFRSNSFFFPTEKTLFYKSKHFERFDYLCNLTRKCSSRVGKIRNMVGKTQFPSSNLVKIRCIGQVTGDNVKSVSKRKGNVFIKIIESNTIIDVSIS